jgi:hypothetical protein
VLSECKSKRQPTKSGRTAMGRRPAIFAACIRQLGGVVSVHPSRDRCSGEPVFRVGHVSGGGDIVFLSTPMMLEDHAAAAARVLAEFVHAKEVKLAP